LDEWNWHLDERPIAEGNNINPDVLGYIFEKYINNKQMGAYYTKEDITGYIGKNTILPFLFDRVRVENAVSFTGPDSVWKRLQDDPDAYIYEAVKHGATLPLPEYIAEGISDVSKRTRWNEAAPDSHGLPTEIWREVVARRERYASVREKLASGQIADIPDFITYNLDIRQFTLDVILETESTDLVKAFWVTLNGSEDGSKLPLSILDPTCGSGAFLFAALEILTPIYQACLDRMNAFLTDAERLGKGDNAYPTFRKVRDEFNKPVHTNLDYYLLKKIIVNNLFGVDIMDEATEICKLRLFLRLASLADPDPSKDNLGVEPLPDIDFNIRAGNTLVGVATKEQMKRIIYGGAQGELAFDDTKDAAWNAYESELNSYDFYYQKFQSEQLEESASGESVSKKAITARLDPLRTKADTVYAIQNYLSVWNAVPEKDRLTAFRHSHKPFHWFVEFYGVMRDRGDVKGGFDCIIGNSPYVEYSTIRSDYEIKNYETLSCGNLYANVMERVELLLKRNGYTGMIIPHSAICTDRMAPVQELLVRPDRSLWVSTYDTRPARLFVGVDQRLAVYIVQNQGDGARYSTRYHRWNEEVRDNLFASIEYASIRQMNFTNSIPKAERKIEPKIWEKLKPFKPLTFAKRSEHVTYFHNGPRYWIRAMNFVPYFWNERGGEKLSSHLKPLSFHVANDALVSAAVLNSSLFYWWFILLSNCRDLTMREIETFPVGLENMSDATKTLPTHLADSLMVSLQKNAKRKDCVYKTTGQVIYDEYYPRHSKVIIDEIDRTLATHYGFTPEETDFIINYDIKYRMGRDAGE
jgi:hypothetical protein